MKSLLCLLLIIPCAFAGNKIDTTPQRDVDFSRFVGRWYEQARFENWFEEGMDNVFTDYIPLQNGSFVVINQGTSSQGFAEQARGRAFVAGPGELAVSFVWPYWWFRAPYKVLYVDSRYQSALVSGEGSEYLWLLTRQQLPAAEMIQKLIREAKQRHFDTSKLRYTQHQNRKSTSPDKKNPGL